MGSRSSKTAKAAEAAEAAEHDMDTIVTCYKLESDLFLNAARNVGAPRAFVETMDNTGGTRLLRLPAHMNLMRPDKSIESHHGRVVQSS